MKYRTERILSPLTAFRGKHNDGGDQNRKEFHQHRRVLLQEEQPERECKNCTEPPGS